MTGWLCMIPFAASLFNACGPVEPLAVGYVEGEYVLLAPYDVAQVVSVGVRRGDRLKAGDVAATLETDDARLAVDAAEAAHLQAKAELDNLLQGKRAEEIAVIEASRNSAIAAREEARRSFDRQRELSNRGFASSAEYDSADTGLALAEAKVAEMEANLAVARLAARPAEIAAARNKVRRAAADLETARWRLAQRVLKAPADGQVFDIVRRDGELAGPSAPVVSFLPDGAVKLKVYVPEAALSSIAPGTRLTVRCDGCPPGASATVSYVSREPEFTPPVIYSINTRQKLVYLVEARPDPGVAVLKPGQIVDVDLAEAAR